MSNPIDDVRRELVGFELEAFSLLFHFWAEPANIKKRKADEWESKLIAFRRALIAGKSTGARRKLEPEIIQAEFACLKSAFEYVQSEKEKKPDIFKNEGGLAKLRIPYRINSGLNIFRPFPVPKSVLKEIWGAFINRTGDFDVVIHKMISKRFGISYKTIKNYIDDPEKIRIRLSINQQLLVSIFLDICSDSGNNGKWQQLRAKILCTLYRSKPECSVIFLCYLVQTAHRLKEKIFVGEYESEGIHELCCAVFPDIEKLAYKPFIRLMQPC
jgi:hypothetical protein